MDDMDRARMVQNSVEQQQQEEARMGIQNQINHLGDMEGLDEDEDEYQDSPNQYNPLRQK